MQNQPILLGINIDHVATLRQVRGTSYPLPLQAAMVAEQAGADGITLHLREDRRHIQDKDVFLIKEMIQTRLNFEMALTQEMIEIALQLKPAYCCLVPERREELTTEGGLDVASHHDKIYSGCQRLMEAGIEVSLFIDPDCKQIEYATKTGATVIEIHTGAYAEAVSLSEQQKEYQHIVEAAKLGQQAGLQVNAGHGLHYHNVQAIAAIPEITELNIGHSIIARAIMTGLHTAVADMKLLMTQARNNQ